MVVRAKHAGVSKPFGIIDFMVAPFQFIENVITKCEQAAELNDTDPLCSGSCVDFSDENVTEVVITGDLHGNRRNFNALKQIADLANNPRRHLILQEVCHGGATYSQNGGCMSHSLLEEVAKFKVEFPSQVHFLLGNHEISEMTEFPIRKGDKMLNLQFRLGMQHRYGPAADKVREAYLRFLSSCPLAARMPNGVFISHSIPANVDSHGFDAAFFDRAADFQDFLENEPAFDLVWGRDYRPENAEAFAELVGAEVLVNGHEPCQEGYAVPNTRQVILDCCGEEARYLLLPTNEPLNHAAAVERIQRVNEKEQG